MRRAFPLAGLLRVRSIAEDRAAAELAEAHRQEQAARDRAIETARLLGSSAATAEAEPQAFRASVAARMAMSALLVEAKADVAVAESRTAQRAQAWSVARQATRTVERLGEKHDEEQRTEELKAEQAALDEIAGRRPTEVTT
ncbi:MAG: flagellar FliJ family protein [Micrococcales bacterium]|nr:flagellar FliJ family protein [Micrococcales bacterium]